MYINLSGCLVSILFFLIIFLIIKELWWMIVGIAIILIVAYWCKKIYILLVKKKENTEYTPNMGEVFMICPYCNSKVKLNSSECPICKHKF